MLRRFPRSLSIGGLVLLLNAGVWAASPGFLVSLLDALEYQRSAIFSGEIWRLVTCNLVHLGPAHLLLDLGVFLLLGGLFEKELGAGYISVLSCSALATGASVLLDPGVEACRGLSGVCHGQFAAGLLAWILTASNRPQLALYLTAAVVFVAKLVYECVTGELIAGRPDLGDFGAPIPLSHVAGTAGALAGWFLACRRRTDQPV